MANLARLQAYTTRDASTSRMGKRFTGETTTMKALARCCVRFPALAALLMITGFLLAQGQPPPIPSIKVVDLIPASLSGETNQDSEPFLAIQTANPQVMVASAFTPILFSKQAMLLFTVLK